MGGLVWGVLILYEELGLNFCGRGEFFGRGGFGIFIFFISKVEPKTIEKTMKI
jgi:hypothetical protein